MCTCFIQCNSAICSLVWVSRCPSSCTTVWVCGWAMGRSVRDGRKGRDQNYIALVQSYTHTDILSVQLYWNSCHSFHDSCCSAEYWQRASAERKQGNAILHCTATMHAPHTLTVSYAREWVSPLASPLMMSHTAHSFRCHDAKCRTYLTLTVISLTNTAWQ